MIGFGGCEDKTETFQEIKRDVSKLKRHLFKRKEPRSMRASFILKVQSGSRCCFAGAAAALMSPLLTVCGAAAIKTRAEWGKARGRRWSSRLVGLGSRLRADMAVRCGV